ncbi:ABC transporter substrate-binding protein [Microbacterium esteraromaticum]|uniref:ABC transporter substrate-binding protein n=1 Tax=Microbacterium esteraromaticum TaxID=57043 RepID=UPI001C95D830|nr:extracellular solute-binding protein [Microbacterium esteraromaticum]MBY6060993.1 extracellular solute-binding protein [Microbacterium esteraromaticum]
MNRTRNIGALGLGVAIAIAVTACSTNAPADGGDGSGAGTLRVASIPNYQASLEALIPQFEKANPDIDVEVEFLDVASYHTTLRTQLTAGTAPDVFSVFAGNGTPTAMEVLATGGYLADLSDFAFNNGLSTGYDATTKVDGKRLVLPYAAGAIGAIYNEQAIEAAGATVPTTYGELLEFCDAATEVGKVAFALGAQTGWINQLFNYAFTATLVYGENPDFDEKQEAGKVTFADSNWDEAVAKVLEMQERGCFQEAPLGTAYEGAVEMVASGDALSMAAVVSTYGALRAAAPEGTTFNMFAIPATDDAADTWMPAGAGGTYAINAAAKNADAAAQFIEFLGSAEAQVQIAELQGSPPANTTGWDAPAYLQVIVDHLADGTVHPYADQLWPNPKVAEMHINGMQQVLGGQTTVEQMLKDMDAAYAEGD